MDAHTHTRRVHRSEGWPRVHKATMSPHVVFATHTIRI